MPQIKHPGSGAVPDTTVPGAKHGSGVTSSASMVIASPFAADASQWPPEIRGGGFDRAIAITNITSETQSQFSEMEAIRHAILGELEYTDELLNSLDQLVLPHYEIDIIIHFEKKSRYLTEGNLDLDSLIAVTGPAQACYGTTCSNYVAETWPRFGSAVLNCLQQANEKGEYQLDFPVQGIDYVLFSLPDHSGIRVMAEARLDMMVELVQLLCWISIVLSGCDGAKEPRAGRTRLIFAYSEAHNGLALSFQVQSFPLGEQASLPCWTPLFRNALVPKNFPVPGRPCGVGLEMPLPLMAQACGAIHAVEFEGGVVIKGFSTMLIPVSKIGTIIQWHLVSTDDPNTRLSYSEGINLCGQRALFDEVPLECLRDSRAVLGWWSYCEIVLDRGATGPVTIQYSSSETAKSGLRLSEISVGFQQFISGEVKIPLASKVLKFHFPRSGPYDAVIDCASRTPAVLFDTEKMTRQAWVLPATMVMLQIAQQRIAESEWMRHENVATARSPEAASRFLRDWRSLALAENYRLQDLILNIWSVMEYLLDCKVARERSPDVEVTLPLQDKLVGFEFAAIAQQRSPIPLKQTRVARTSGGWTRLIRDVDALVLFGSGFGELIRPLKSGELCRGWKQLPTGKDYLAVPTTVLRDLYKTAGSADGREFLTSSKLRLYRGNSLLFEPCGRPGEVRCGCKRLQQVIPPSSSGTVPSLIAGKTDHAGVMGALFEGHEASIIVGQVGILEKQIPANMQGTNRLYTQKNAVFVYEEEAGEEEVPA